MSPVKAATKPAKRAAAKAAAKPKTAPKAAPPATLPSAPAASMPPATWTPAPARMPPVTWAPAPTPPAPIAPTSPANDTAGVGKVLVILLIVSMAYGLLSSALLFAGLPYLVIALLGGLSFLVSVPTIIVFCIWLYRTLANARDRHPGEGIRAGWAVGAFFIPVVQLFAPYLEVRKGWRADTRRGEGLPATWFVAWSLSTVLGVVVGIVAAVAQFGVILDNDARPGTDEYEQAQEDAQEAAFAAQRPFLPFSEALHLVAGIALILVVRHWSKNGMSPPAS